MDSPAPPAGDRATRVFFAAAIFVPLAILGVVGFLSHREIEDEAADRARRMAFALSEHALRTLRAHELLMDAVDRYIAGLTWKQIASSRQVHEFFVQLARNEDVNTVFVIDPTGLGGNSSLRFPLGPIDVRNRSFFEAPKSGEALHVSLPDVGRINRQRLFSLARKRSAPEGAFDGIISISVNPAYFENFYARILETPEDAAGIARADGAVLARVPRIPEGRVFYGRPLMQAVQKNGDRGTFASTADGVQRLFAYQRVGTYPLYVAYGLSRSAVWSAWTRRMAIYGAICGIAMALLLAAALVVRSRTRREWRTAQAHAEEVARRAVAEEASRAKDEFLAMLSHELRNPLAAISNSAALIEQRPPAEPHAREAMDIVSRQTRHLQRMLDDLLDVARTIFGKVRLEPQEIELGAFAREVVEASAAARSQRARMAVTGAPAWVSADPTRLRQMLENLLDNAVKFGGRNVAVEIGRDHGMATLAVIDDGEGIATELLPRLFQPFVQGAQALDRSRGGLGLGLSLVSRLATLHGGTLRAASAGPGKGSRFELALPAVAPALKEPRPAPRPGGAARRVLIIEDHADARESLQKLLTVQGHEVAVAADGPQGLEALRRFRPEIALVDIGLPGMDGYAWAREARALPEGRTLTLVALTGYGQVEDRERAAAAGFDRHLTKPVGVDLLSEVLAVPAPRVTGY